MEIYRFFHATMIIQEIPINNISTNCIITVIANIPVSLVTSQRYVHVYSFIVIYRPFLHNCVFVKFSLAYVRRLIQCLAS